MSSVADWKNVKYNETLEEELRGLQRRRNANPSLTVEDIEGVLKHLYILYGGEGDRGEVQELARAATIAAYESFIADWKAEVKTL